MGPLGWPETVFIVLLALLLFGPKKLPELGRMLGKAITEFRRASSELRTTFDREMKNLEREVEGAKETAVSHYQDSYNYENSSYDAGAPYSPPSYIQETHQEAGALNGATVVGAAAQATVGDAEAARPVEHPTEGVSALEGAPLTTAEPSPAPVVTPALGTVAVGSIAGGSLPSNEHALNIAPGPVRDLDQPAAQETLKS
jgi:TatA/E family protein of Tat protein translocase